MVSPTYKSQSSWDLYAFLVFNQNTSEGICDALLAVSEAMKRFKPGTSMPDSSLVELSNHIGQKTLRFLKDDIPYLLQYPNGLYKNIWSSQFATSTSQGLKWSIEKTTIRFIENLTNSFSKSSKSWTYTPDLLHDAFKEIAISFEKSLGKEYDNHRQSRAASVSNSVDTLSASLYTLSLSSSQDAGSGRLTGNTTPARSSSSAICYNCNQPGHYSSNCTRPKKGSITPSRSSSSAICYNCNQPGHYSSNCTRPKKGSMTPSRSSSNATCYNCNQRGHYSRDCTSPKKRRECFKCGAVGHYANACNVR
jgi:Zinc knuckle